MPSPQDYRFSVPLTSWVRNYKWDLHTMAQDLVAPIVMRKNASGQYQAFGLDMFDIYVDDAKGPKSPPNMIDYSSSLTSFTAKEYALGIIVSDKEKKEALSPWSPMQQAAATLKHALKLRKEVRIVDIADGTGNSTTIGTDWDTATTILADVAAGKIRMRDLMGWSPNLLVWGDHVGDEVAANATVVGYLQNAASMAQPTSFFNFLTGDELAKKPFMGLQIVAPNARYNTAIPGATGSYGNVWGDDAYLFHTSPAAQSARWAVSLTSLALSIRTVRDERIPGTMVIGSWEYVVTETTANSIDRMADVT